MTDDKLIQTARERFGAFLRQRNKRQTPERFAILDRVLEATDHFSIETFHGRLEAEGYHVSTGTVYNTFQLLCEAGFLRRHRFAHKSAEYERVNPGGNHTHLICTACGRVREVRDPAFGESDGPRRYSGFRPSYFALYVYGTCSRCARRRNKS